MSKIDNAVMENVTVFLERLKAAGMQIAGAWLFGSHLTGKADEWSDIDVAVISPQIGPDRFEERVRLTKIAFAVDDRIEPLPFSPDSFTQDDPLVREILRTGIRV
jgi:predicted nucleotidyltransferase